MTTIFIIGRILLGGFFLINAYSHFKNATSMAGYATGKGVPHAKLAVQGSGVLLLIAGLSIITGFMTGLGILAGVLFLVPTTFIMHAYWKISDPNAKMMEHIQFNKNMAILGALLMLSLFISSWPASL